MRAPFFVVVAAVLIAALSPAHAQQTPFSNFVSGSASSSDANGHVLLTQPSGDRRMFVTSLQCSRSDAGTTAITVTLNDDASTKFAIPGTTGGAFVAMVFSTPLTVAGNLTFAASAGVSTLWCSAQAYSGN